MRIAKKSWGGLFFTLGLTACLSLPDPPLSPASSPSSQRLVIQFKPQYPLCNSEGIKALSRATGVSLALVRSMDKGGCVVDQLADHPNHFLKQQKKVAAHYSIQWLEPDRRMHAF